MAMSRLTGLTIEEATAPIRDAVAASVAAHALTLLVGGNNAVTRPGVLGLGVPLEKVGLITLDAHFDMRDSTQGLSNGNPVRALIEDGLPGENIAQVGLAPFANSAAMHRDAVAAGNLRRHHGRRRARWHRRGRSSARSTMSRIATRCSSTATST